MKKEYTAKINAPDGITILHSVGLIDYAQKLTREYPQVSFSYRQGEKTADALSMMQLALMPLEFGSQVRVIAESNTLEESKLEEACKKLKENLENEKRGLVPDWKWGWVLEREESDE
jgi:phosphotransferase system HPr-like phosphotransfer protein